MIASSKVGWGEAIVSRSYEIWNTSRQAPQDAISAASNYGTNAMPSPHKLLNGIRDLVVSYCAPPSVNSPVCPRQCAYPGVHSPVGQVQYQHSAKMHLTV